jgi:hypothetical protein
MLRRWQSEPAVLYFKVGRQFGNGGFLRTALALPGAAADRATARRLSLLDLWREMYGNNTLGFESQQNDGG